MPIFPYTAEKYIRESFKPIPEGIYKVKINAQKEVENGMRTAKGINISYGIIENDLAGRIVFDSFYLEHPNKDFEKREKNRFNGLLEAIGLQKINSLPELNGRALTIKIKIDKASSDGKYPEKNRVVDYFNYSYKEENNVVFDKDNDLPF